MKICNFNWNYKFELNRIATIPCSKSNYILPSGKKNPHANGYLFYSWIIKTIAVDRLR